MGTAFERFDLNADGRLAMRALPGLLPGYPDFRTPPDDDHLGGHDPNVLSITFRTITSS